MNQYINSWRSWQVSTRYGLRVAGFAVQGAGCELRVTGCELRVTGCGVRVAGYGLRVTLAVEAVNLIEKETVVSYMRFGGC